MQLGGAGLDARAIELVDWQHKKKIGPMAYVVAGLRALREPQPKLTVHTPGHRLSGALVLVGNGRYYGGRMEFFKDASRRDGLLDVCVFPRVKSLGVLSDVLYAAVSGRLPEGNVQRLRAAEFTVTAEPGAGFELDGEHAGRLPVKFGVDQERLRVIVP
jgi:diacylglycerol kinase family enzyme